MNPIHLQSYIHPPRIHMSKIAPTGPPGRYQKDVSPSSLRRNVFRIVGKFGEKLGGIFPGVHVGKINEDIGILQFFLVWNSILDGFFPGNCLGGSWNFSGYNQVTSGSFTLARGATQRLLYCFVLVVDVQLFRRVPHMIPIRNVSFNMLNNYKCREKHPGP